MRGSPSRRAASLLLPSARSSARSQHAALDALEGAVERVAALARHRLRRPEQRQVGDADARAAAAQQRELDHGVQLVEVAGPVVGEQALLRLRLEPDHRPAQDARGVIDRQQQQRRQVLGPLAQRRDAQRRRKESSSSRSSAPSCHQLLRIARQLATTRAPQRSASSSTACALRSRSAAASSRCTATAVPAGR